MPLDESHQNHFWYWTPGRCGVAIKPHLAAGSYPSFMVVAGHLSGNTHAMEKALAESGSPYSCLQHSFVGRVFH
jgi:hypothetical protein